MLGVDGMSAFSALRDSCKVPIPDFHRGWHRPHLQNRRPVDQCKYCRLLQCRQAGRLRRRLAIARRVDIPFSDKVRENVKQSRAASLGLAILGIVAVLGTMLRALVDHLVMYYNSSVSDFGFWPVVVTKRRSVNFGF